MPGKALLGRDRELAAVDRFLDGPYERPAALAFTGPAGIGKTTVWSEAARRAADRGWRVIAARPAQSEARLAFAGLADMLERVELDQLPSVQRRALELALLRTESGAGAIDARAIATAVLTVIRKLAEQTPVLVAVDDAQWLDAATAEALAFATRRCDGLPVKALVSVRVEGARPRTFEQVLEATEIPIGPLSVAALHEVVRQHLSIAIPRPTLVQIVVASGGNAFYAVEIARELAREGMPAPGARLPVPPSLMTLVNLRVAGLPPETKAALLLAACLSHPTGELVDLAALEPAEEAGIVVVERGGRIRFDHPLLATAVYESATASRRLQAHRLLAEKVTDPEEQALHLASGVTATDEEIAQRLDSAAVRASGRGATGMAAHLARRAVELTPGDRARRIIAAVEYMSEAAQSTSDATALLERGLRDCEDPELRAELFFTLAKVTRGEEGPRSGLRGLEQALKLARDRVLKGKIHGEIAWQLVTDLPRALEHCDAALALLREDDNPTLYSTLLLLRTYMRLVSGQGPDEEAVDRGRQMQLGMGRDASPVPLAWPVMGDDLDEGRRRYERAVAVSRAVGDELSGVSLLSHLAELELWSGNWPRADELAAEAVELVERSGSAAFLNLALYARGIVDAHLGRSADAREIGERILALDKHSGADRVIRGHMVLGFLALSVDDMNEAARQLGAVAALLDRRGEREPARYRIHGDLAEAVIALGDLERGATILERLEERSRVFPRPWILAITARCRSLLLAARGQLDAALEMSTEALVQHDRLAMPFERARTQLVHGRLLRRRNSRRAARAMLADSLGEFERLGAPLWAAKAREEMSRVPVRKAAAGLTPTEEKIARLAAEGFTNREVAERAFVSAKTVEANLARVYDKLGVRSRAELGRVMAGRGANT